MKLTKQERAILANQFRILEKLDSDQADMYSNNAEILEGGYEGLYSKALGSISSNTHSEEEYKEIVDILDLYRWINLSINSLTQAQKDEINLEKANFPGFDANEGEHYSQVVLMVKMGMYGELDEHNLNSHDALSMTKYRNMMKLAQSYWSAHKYREFTLEQIKALLEE